MAEIRTPDSPPQVSPAEPEPGTTRRRFYLTFIYGLWSLIAAALAAPALLYLFLPPKLRQEPEWDDAGDISKLAPGFPVEMSFRKNRVDGWKVSSEQETTWVVKLPDQKIVAFGPQCTHLGCAYHWDERKSEFICPCHSSVFGMNGKVISGPAPRPLDRFDIKIENGRLLLGALRESTGSNA
ncbi:MAG TPA: ubiquinol-cytochrome c reductase iron-sulfur subunit [Bryobacteraceae bacterium]|nr:ubiquinol-cytochrome c reductase iron-sulfur subunit [Bryobacteraceae bacterium]